MAKELPYFRFNISEWQNGDITLENEETQGAFINICCYYWNQNCSITQAKLKQKFKHCLSSVDALLKSEIIKANENDDFIEIDFLDEQFSLLTDLRKKRQEAGRKGGKQSLSKPKAKLKQNASYKDKDKDKDKDKESQLPYGAKFKSTWKDWEQHRKEKRQKLTPSTNKRQIKKLSNYKSESVAIAVIEQSITNGWTGLFDLDNNKSKPKPAFEQGENNYPEGIEVCND